MAAEARGEGCVAGFVRPDAGGQKWTLRKVSGGQNGWTPTAAMRLSSPEKSQRSKDFGGIAQLVERLVRNEKVRGSNPLTSTNFASANQNDSSGDEKLVRPVGRMG